MSTIKQLMSVYPVLTTFAVSLAAGVLIVFVALPPSWAFIAPLAYLSCAGCMFVVSVSIVTTVKSLKQRRCAQGDIAFVVKAWAGFMLLAVVIFLFTPSYVARKGQLAEAEVYKNMGSFAEVIEDYRRLHGQYPQKANELQLEQATFINPFSYRFEQVSAGSNAIPIRLEPGQIQYCPITDRRRTLAFNLYGGGLWGKLLVNTKPNSSSGIPSSGKKKTTRINNPA
jgi:hypothetical protein